VRVSKAVAAAISLLLCAAAFASPVPAPPNFGVVVSDGIYRGGQPTSAHLKYLHELGIRTIVKLNKHNLDKEREEAERLGMSVVSIPLEPSTVGDADSCSDVAKAVAAISDRSRWPVFVHCSLGRDRAGFVVGAYRELVEGQQWPAIDQELRRYGHASAMRRAYPQISRELENGIPTCGGEIARVLSRQSPPPAKLGAPKP
jgi:protein tyrosine/serine phosphatase